jgi:hypothetical protein
MANDKVITNTEIYGAIIKACVIDQCSISRCRLNGSTLVNNSALRSCDVVLGSDAESRVKALEAMANPNFTDEMLVDAVDFYLSARVIVKE